MALNLLRHSNHIPIQFMKHRHLLLLALVALISCKQKKENPLTNLQEGIWVLENSVQQTEEFVPPFWILKKDKGIITTKKNIFSDHEMLLNESGEWEIQDLKCIITNDQDRLVSVVEYEGGTKDTLYYIYKNGKTNFDDFSYSDIGHQLSKTLWKANFPTKESLEFLAFYPDQRFSKEEQNSYLKTLQLDSANELSFNEMDRKINLWFQKLDDFVFLSFKNMDTKDLYFIESINPEAIGLLLLNPVKKEYGQHIIMKQLPINNNFLDSVLVNYDKMPSEELKNRILNREK